MRLLIAAADLPFPPDSGSRADVWRRLVALAGAGAEIFLICWFDGPVDERAQAAARRALAPYTVAARFYPIHRGAREALRRLTLLSRAPSHAASRRLEPGAYRDILEELRSFRPDAIWVEGLWPAFSARRLAHDLAVPYFYRSHNIEHRYMSGQARVAHHWRDSLALRIATVGLESFELSVLRAARWIYDVSEDDATYWRTRGIRCIRQLLPLPGIGPPEAGEGSVAPSRDIVFLGNLRTPNNVAGIQWLLGAVRPIVDAARPGARWTVAGSNPVPLIRELARAGAAVELLEDVPDVAALLRSARVLVNPVRTGSGVMVKMLDMLMTNAPIISSPQGLAGLPVHVRDSVRVAATSEAFARAITEELRESSVDIAQRSRLRTSLWQDSGAALLREIEQRCAEADRDGTGFMRAGKCKIPCGAAAHVPGAGTSGIRGRASLDATPAITSAREQGIAEE